MFTRIRDAIDSGKLFWTYVVLVGLSAMIQASVVLVLFPLCRSLFSDSPGSAWPWVLLVIVLSVTAWIFDIISAHRGLDIGLTIMRRIHRSSPDALLAWPNSRFTATMTADLRRLLSQGATEATSGLVLIFSPLITSVAYIFTLGVGLLFVYFPAGVATILGGVLALGALWCGSRLKARADRQFEEATGDMDHRLFEFAYAQPSLRTSRHIGAGTRLVDRAIDSNRGRVLKLLIWQIPGEFLFSVVAQAVLIVFGAVVWFGYDAGALTAVAAATMIIVLLRVIEQVSVLSGISEGINNLNRSLELADQIIQTTPESAIDRADVWAAPPEVKLQEIDIAFDDGTVGLRGIDLTVDAGSVTVVIGASGAGKTTLMRTLAGLVAPTAGTVTLNGNSVNTTELRSVATVAFQHTVLNSGTLRENLLAVNPDLTEDSLSHIAEGAQLESLIADTPQGWDTPAGELGVRLSGGERQRVGIARALAKPARVLLVDEATSALDTVSERAVVNAVDRFRGRYTTVVITHRPAMLDIADHVVVMGEGRVLEAGTPFELEAKNGEYARLLRGWRAAAQWQVQ